MFTGIVGEVGMVGSVARQGGTVVISVVAPRLAPEVAIGDSVSVNGVCQTVTAVTGQTFTFDSVTETLNKTNLSSLRRGSKVNLELALRLGDRISGHLVTGHVDCMAVVRTRRTVSIRNVDFALQVPERFCQYIHEKGSICLDGVSLTVKAVRGTVFEVTLIPFTLENTIIGTWRVGTSVNMEVDQLAKYLAPSTRTKGGGKA